MLFLRSRLQDNDPFILLKMIFAVAGYHKIGKLINYICFIFHSSTMLLEMDFLIQNFSTSLLLKYGCFTILMLFVCN